MREVFHEEKKRKLMEESGYREQFSFDTAADTRLFQVEAGEYLVREGERPWYLYYLVKGRAKLYATLPNGRVSLIDFFKAPCFVGEMELVNEEHEARAVQAMEESWCLALPVRQYRERLLNDARFLRNLCILFNRKNYRNVVSLIRNQSFPLANRLASFILLTESGGYYQEKHTQAAEYLGVSYRHLLYVLSRFTEAGMLKKQGRGYEIVDKAALAELAGEMGDEKSDSGGFKTGVRGGVSGPGPDVMESSF